MSMMRRMADDLSAISSTIYEREQMADKAREQEHVAAIIIQSWLRKMKVQAYFKHLKRSAIVMQKAYRGYKGRQRFRQTVANAVQKLNFEYYFRNAVVIQKLWKGYYVRKYVFNYYSRRHYLNELVIKNEVVREELAKAAEDLRCKHDGYYLEEEMKRQYEWARRNHFLVSTSDQPGIYNSPYYIESDKRETLLRTVPPRTPPKQPRHLEKRFEDRIAKSYYEIAQVDPAQWEEKKNLPPPQGPFRRTESVLQQRYRPFRPSLRVETDYCSLEQAREQLKSKDKAARVVEDAFQPFSSSTQTYDSLLWRTGKFGPIKYGTMQFRDDCNLPFKTVLPPIHDFSKFTQTYSAGEV